MSKRAIVLFAHGARSASWRAPFERLAELVAARNPDAAVSLAFLELMEPRLPEAVHAAIAAGAEAVSIVPIFLGQGGHVLRDLPPLVADLRAAHPQVPIALAEAVGENAAVLEAIAAYCSAPKLV
ncbi:sirohydrochlorin chelatase [Massilia sp. TS11]|uniref:sirohydrochlorin chelatase n=1 Tax=Massilia sp. TS11 TaxID=2908003 RepID=UPI001EDB5535|nr:CbiX/SirB N-terminal domain-containing protein [Massilia sp. TS11]MCG2586597.1 CbiX/SirB N-terminal domain-containing protein [Massilia sp. TS11]